MTVEWASPVALAEFRRQVRVHDVPYWRLDYVVQILNLADGESPDVPVGTLLLLPVLQFCVSCPVDFESQLTHECRYSPQINYPENNYLIHEFHIASAAENHPPSDVKSSFSSSVAKS
jgi:hypothetical protein